MSSVFAHWQAVTSSATSFYRDIVMAVTTIAASLLIFRRFWKTPNKLRNDMGSKEVTSMMLFQGSSNFQISETNAAVILKSDEQFTRSQRKLICDCIANLPDINNSSKEHVLTQSITTLPRAEAGLKDYRNQKKSEPCFKGTRVALLREMADCVTGSSESRVCVLFGPTGIGKSTVAYTIASRAAELNLLGASFFFSRDEAYRNNAERFFTTIAYQLCVYNQTFAKAIGDALKTKRGSAATTKNPETQLQALILDPLQSIAQSHFRPILIVVDALDECDEEDASSVLTGLSQLVLDLPPFRVILTTRPKSHFDRFWGSQGGRKFFHVKDMEDKVVDGDIRLYLDHNLSMKQVQKSYLTEQWCASDEEIDFLVCAAGRFFIIASTAIRYILDKTASNPATQMQKLLRASTQDHTHFNDLDCFYTVVLRDVVPEDCVDDDIISRYQSVVGTIILVQHSLSVSTLAHLIGIDMEEIRVVLGKLQSVILLGDDDVPRVYHKSFPEYLTDQTRCKDPHLRIYPRIRHAQIATRCFGVLNKHLKYNILSFGDLARFMSNEDGLVEDGMTDEQLEEKIPQQLRYACVYWANHLDIANIDDVDLMSVLERKLDSAHHAILVVLKLLKLSSDLHQLLSDAIRFITRFSETIKGSALHTYYSALPFSPTDSLLYRRYIKEAEHSICTIAGGPEQWDGLVATLSHGEIANVIKFSPDSALFVSCSVKYDHNYKDHEDNLMRLRNQGKLKIWDAVTGKPISTVAGHRSAVANDFSTVASSQDNMTMLHNINGSPSGIAFTTSSEIQQLALSSESSRVAAALSDGTVWLWDSGNAKLIDSFDGFEGNVWFSLLQFSPTGTRLAYSSANGTVKLWDGNSRRFIADLQCGSNWLYLRFQFSHDGSRIASLSDDSLALWNSENGGLLGATEFERYDWQHFAISANASLLAIGNTDRVQLWCENCDHLAEAKIDSQVLYSTRSQSMAFSLDNILAIATDSDIKLYNIKTHSFIHAFPFDKCSIRVPLAFSPDCTHLAVGDNDGNVNLWDIRGIDASSEATPVTKLALSRDCSQLACGFVDGRIELWGTNPTKRRIAFHQAHKTSVQALVFCPDSGLFASGSNDGSIKLWNSKDGSLRGSLQVLITSEEVVNDTVKAMALSNSMLVSAGFGGVTLWSIDTLSLIHTFKESSNSGTPWMCIAGIAIASSYEKPTVSIAENSALIAVAHLRGVTLLDAVNHRTIFTFNVHDEIHTMSFLPDNLQLVAQSKDCVFLSFNFINKQVVKGAAFEHLIQLPNISLWRGVPIWHCLDNEQLYFTALFPQHKSPIPVLWIPKHILVTTWTQGSSMIALLRWDGRVILLQLPTSDVG